MTHIPHVGLCFLTSVCVCGDVTISSLDGKLPLAGLWVVLVEVILSKERIHNYSFFLISRRMELTELSALIV